MKQLKYSRLLACVLCLALGFTTVAQAEQVQTAPAKSAPAPVTRNKIEYQDYSSYTQLLGLFPQAKEIVERYGQKPAKPDDAILRSSGAFAKVNEAVYIYQSTTDEDCGLRGCTTVVFSTNEDGFYPSAFILTAMFPPEYEVDKYGEPSIFTCTVDLEWIEWKRRDSMEMTGEPVADENCERFMSVYNETAP